MLSLELIVIFAFLFGFVVCMIVVTELERREHSDCRDEGRGREG